MGSFKPQLDFLHRAYVDAALPCTMADKEATGPQQEPAESPVDKNVLPSSGRKGCDGIALRIIEKEKVCFQHPIQEEDRRCSCTQKSQHPADVMNLRAKSTDKQKDWIEDQQNVDAVGMQVQQIPDW